MFPNPIDWFSSAISSAASDAGKALMLALWAAGLYMLKLAFELIDMFTTPNLTAKGPLGAVLPYTFFLGGAVALLFFFVQLTVAMIRRRSDGLGQLLFGLGQFALVWAGYLGYAALWVSAAAQLTRGLLTALLGVGSFSDYSAGSNLIRTVNDGGLAVLLGVLSFLLLIPAAVGYIVIMLVREAALLIIAATAPISAGGLLSDIGKTWLWKTARWFHACVLISPLTALVLGIGVKINDGIIAGRRADTTAAIGESVVGVVIVAVGCVCPLVLFKLLAFVEPGTPSGQAARAGLAAAGGLGGLLGRFGKPSSSGDSNSDTGSGAAAQADEDGTSQGEKTAEAGLQSRVASATGPAGQAGQQAASTAKQAAAAGDDILDTAGVGHPNQATDNADDDTDDKGRGGDRGDDPDPEPPEPPDPQPPDPAGPQGAGGASGGSVEAAAVVAA